MDKKKEIEEINDLIALDRDAVSAYDSAIKAINAEPIRSQMQQYQNEHRRHITELSQVVRDLGGQPRESNDVKGFFVKGFTAVTSSMGPEAGLKGIEGNGKLLIKRYEEAKSKDFSPAVKSFVDRYYKEESRRLSWYQQALQGRIWEGGAAHP